MPYQREAAIVLEMWREIERALARVPEGTDEAEELQAEAARLRNEYQRLIDEATKYHRPVPPPMPPAASHSPIHELNPELEPE